MTTTAQPDTRLAQVRNVSGEDRVVPALGDRRVLAGQVVDVPAFLVVGLTQQETVWAPFDALAKALHQRMLDDLALLIAAESATPEEQVAEHTAGDLVKSVIPGMSSEQLSELIAAEEALARPRKTVLAAAEKRAAELAPPDDTTHDDPAPGVDAPADTTVDDNATQEG